MNPVGAVFICDMSSKRLIATLQSYGKCKKTQNVKSLLAVSLVT